MDGNTVFIIGAGASKEVKLPLGSDLKSTISKKLAFEVEFGNRVSGDHEIFNALKLHCVSSGEDLNDYLKEGCHMYGALPLAISIDNFIDNHRGRKETELLGKLGIVQSILEAERNSWLHFDQTNFNKDINYNILDETWYLSFFHMLTENCELGQLADRFSQITLIIFNYDRCIEHFLLRALRRYYGATEEQAKELLTEKMKILHPYGKVGRLLSMNNSENIEFGAKVNHEQLLELSRRIKTFTESMDKNSQYIETLRGRMRHAEKLVFLGFGFHELNMQLLSQPRGQSIETLSDFNFPYCYASCCGIKESGQRIIKDRIMELYDPDRVVDFNDEEKAEKINMREATCQEFFSHYLLSLGFSSPITH